MTDAEKITIVETMVDDGASSVTLSTYLTIAGQKILNRAYPYDSTVEEVPACYHILQCEIAAYLYNKRGAEGETVHNENGVYRSYGAADVPKELLSQIVPMTGVV